MDQTTESARTRISLIRSLTFALPLLGLTGCVSQQVRDLEWCRNIETAKPLIDETGQAKLNAAMTKNKCADKLLEAKKAAEEAEKLKAAKAQPAKAKQTIKNPAKAGLVKTKPKAQNL